MSSLEPLIGIVIVVAVSILVILYSTRKMRTKKPANFRKIAVMEGLRHQIGRAVEDGTRVHVSLGSGKLIDPANTSALVGLSALHRIAQLTSNSDLPPICTNGNGSFQVLSQDVLKNNTLDTATDALFDPQSAQLAGVTPFSYALGTIDAKNDAGVSSNVFVGHFGAEAGFLCDTAESKNIHTLGASDSIIAQSIFFALTPNTLLGEELYALPAYLGYQATHQASLRVQDILRLLIGGVLVAGSILAGLGAL